MGPKVRILVADDHEIVRRGARAVLETQPGWEVVAEAKDGREAVEKAEQEKPDVVLLDISMPELNGLEAARRIRHASPGTEVLVFTMHDSEQMVYEGIGAGARGYLLKSDAGRNLVAAVDCVRRRKPFFSPTIADAASAASAKMRNGSFLETGNTASGLLTAREREVVQMLAEGKSNKDIATALNIAVKTAATHRTNVMRKLKVHSIAALVRYAIHNKIVEP